MFPPISRGRRMVSPTPSPLQNSRVSRVGGDTPFPLLIEGTTEKQWPPPTRVEE